MNKDQYFRELVALPSPSLKEEPVASYIKNKMRSFGYMIREDKTGNILCIRGDADNRIILSGHMDTVPPAVNAVLLEDENRYFTDGTTALGADDKCALAVLLEKAENYTGNSIAFLFTAAEEIGLYGSKHIDPSLFSDLNISSAYIMDAEKEVGTIINEAAGKSRIKVSIKGRSAHAGFNPEEGISAIVIASKIIASMPHGRIDEMTTLNIGSFTADGSVNIVPDNAEFLMEVRCLSEEKKNTLITEIKHKSEAIAASLGGIALFDIEDQYHHFVVSESSETITAAIAAMEKAGIKPLITHSMGGSDANNLNNMGIKAIVLSSGYFNAHSKSEYLDKLEFDALARFADAISEC